MAHLALSSRRAASAALFFLFAIGIATPMAVAADDSHPAMQGPTPKAALRARRNVAATPLRREWGIEVLGIHQTSAGYMLQFQYRVLDPKAAKPLFDRKTKPYLTDLNTGAKVVVPSPEKIGQLRNVSSPETGRIYWMLFANPAKMIKKGNPVRVRIGDFDSGTLIVDDGVTSESPVRSAAK